MICWLPSLIVASTRCDEYSRRSRAGDSSHPAQRRAVRPFASIGARNMRTRVRLTSVVVPRG